MKNDDGKAEAVVIGAGVIGCAVALELARQGVEVVVVDPAEPGSRSTRAAGGMLAPLAEADAPGPFLELGLESFGRYPAWIREVEDAAGVGVGYLRSGKLKLALETEAVDRLRRRGDWIEEAGFEARWLEPGELRERVPALSRKVRGGLLLEDERQVDNRRLGPALAEAARRAGARFRIGRSVTRLIHDGERLRAAELDDGSRIGVERAVLAAGAWSGQVEGLPGGLPVRPVRGQMVALDPPPGTLRHIVDTGRVYLIPREPGPLLVGATQEEAGFRCRTTVDGISGLLAGAVEVLPELGRAPVLESWAGLRPGTPDGLPILGPDPDLDGLFHASGHFRNGILLAPVTGRILAGLVLDDAALLPSLDLDPFRPGRFR